ncbi:hypothetical protein J2855_003661 [Agrobacterium tumefaciens]|nr:hypothetical protein [Agrobacterium tumefaciens]MBP2519467.1 hypothetical protein [Agrobacterium tumefaciens]MBP2578206.1 hypothetical protein [Agrobacterium tumefaciens]MBP2596152.1 hypothetical protein [Agrobacterium tumefaciens]
MFLTTLNLHPISLLNGLKCSPKKATTVPRKGFINGLYILRETFASVGFTSIGLVSLGGVLCSNMKGQRVYSLLALEYRNTKGETFRMVHSFGITDSRIIAVITLLSRIFP